MTLLFKIVGVGLIGGIFSVFLKAYRREYALLCAMATGLAILFMTAGMIGDTAERFLTLGERVGIGERYIKIIIKTIGTAYIAEFAVQILKDAGEGSTASKVELAGKLFILYLIYPVIAEFLEVCIDAVGSI